MFCSHCVRPVEGRDGPSHQGFVHEMSQAGLIADDIKGVHSALNNMQSLCFFPPSQVYFSPLKRPILFISGGGRKNQLKHCPPPCLPVDFLQLLKYDDNKKQQYCQGWQLTSFNVLKLPILFISFPPPPLVTLAVAQSVTLSR